MTSTPDPLPETTIKPIAELFLGGCSALWATTYSMDLGLFNEFLLPRLGEPPLNAVVLMDHRRLASSLERIPADRVDTLARVNRHWLLRGVPLGGRAFHPKTYLAVRGSLAVLLVGSGNLTEDGLDRGREVFTRFQSGTPAGDAAIRTWAGWVRRLVEGLGDTTLAERFTDLQQRVPASVADASTESSLLDNLDVSIADQLFRRLPPGIRVDEMRIAAPFFDQHGDALCHLLDDYGPKRLHLYLTTSTSVDGPALRRRLEARHTRVEVSFYEPDQFVHAKLVGLIAGEHAWLLSGSANLSGAALTETAASGGNVELAVLTTLTPADLDRVLIPPGTVAVTRPVLDVDSLTFRSDPEPTAPPVHLKSAILRPGDVIEVTLDTDPEDDWQLADHLTTTTLTRGPGAQSATTTAALAGRLVRVVSGSGLPLSNRAVVEDPTALAAVLVTGTAKNGTNRPAELLAADTDSPLGAAISWLHRNLVMDVSERAAPAPTGGVAEGEEDEQRSDDLWARLEREQLTRDPRADIYTRIARRANALAGDPLLELLEAFGARVPTAPLSDSHSFNVLEHLLHTTGDDEDSADPNRRWKQTTRIRVRARNVLRRWAAAQNDSRLTWVNPLAPAGNFIMITQFFAQLRIEAAARPESVELTEDDLDDLWLRWLRPYVGSGSGDGWLDRLPADLAVKVRERSPSWLPEAVAALSWATIRPGYDRRQRILALQPMLGAALRADLLAPTTLSARVASAIIGRTVSLDELETDLLSAIDFVDDALWCERLEAELDLPRLVLKPSPGSPQIQVTLIVEGISQPLVDTRTPRLMTELLQYRHCDGVALYSGDAEWRLVMTKAAPTVFRENESSGLLQTPSPIASDELHELVSSAGVLANLFGSEPAQQTQ